MSFYKQMQQCLNEKDVENRYRELLSSLFKGAILHSPGSVDGYMQYKNINMLMEFKHNVELTKKTAQCVILVQTLYYIKQMQKKGDAIPNVLFIGDINEFAIIHSNVISDYLKDDSIDWSIAPSQAPAANKELILKMYNDGKINFAIFDITQNTDINTIRDQIHNVAESGSVERVKITTHNIERVFDVFVNNAIKNKDKHNANQLVSIFINLITNPYENYLHPKKKNILVTPSGDISVDGKLMSALFLKFEDVYSPKEKEELVATCDRLITDYDRRMKGEFYTPTIWVDEAHKEISKVFGNDWKEKYVVWDPAWGTGNLTRDYSFKELYCSTINQSDIDIANQNGINMNAVKFQYDFLNDGVDDKGVFLDDKLPRGLKEAFEGGKEIIVFMNPPYMKPSGHGCVEKSVKSNILSKNSSLYIQFLYKLTLLNGLYHNVNICTYSPLGFITGKASKNFRLEFLEQFNYTYGMMLSASHFDGTSKWGILVSIWKPGKNINEFICEAKDIYIDNFEEYIKVLESKCLYNIDSYETIRSWYTENLDDVIEYPCLTSATTVVSPDRVMFKLSLSNIGWFTSLNNDIKHSMTEVSITSLPLRMGTSTKGSIILNNFNKVISVFAARKLVEPTWINQKDEYMIPNTEHHDYQQWNIDCIIYSLFNGASNQSSLRQIDYKGKTWNIENQWFWLSNKELQDLANQHNFDELYQDTKTFPNDKFIYNKLNEINLSPDALAVLEKAKELVRNSFKYRQIMHEEHPEYHLQAWDAGWYQIKKILKEYMKEDLKEFNDMYKKFSERLRPYVYEFGFLRK